jgi:alcohol dehydrogenase class IV
MNAFVANWNYPTTIWFGDGRITELPDACHLCDIKKPLLVTDPGLAESEMLLVAIAHLKTMELTPTVFSNIKPNPTGGNVDDGVNMFRDNHCDGVIAFGGGSAIDAAKAIALMINQEHPLWDFEDVGDNYLRANADTIPPIIAIPTTAGTGSEVGRAAVVLNEAIHAKKIIFHPKLLPSVVIADPALTVSLPKHLTAATGMDALAHNLEAFCAPGFHPLADGIALEGMRLIKENLVQAVNHGDDLTARANMLAAASMGATAFQKGLGAIHALSHPLGALTDAHHGLLNAVFMPYVLAFNRKAIEEKAVHLARYLDLPSASFDGLMEWILSLRQDIGIPHRLQNMGIDGQDADKLATMAMADPSCGGNPVPLTEKGLKEIYLAAESGNLLS